LKTDTKNSPAQVRGNDWHEMSLKEFVEGGYLQEANRLFFHPLGIAIAVKVNDDDPNFEQANMLVFQSDDPDGIVFAEISPAHIERAKRISDLTVFAGRRRLKQLGFGVQPLEGGGKPKAELLAAQRAKKEAPEEKEN